MECHSRGLGFGRCSDANIGFGCFTSGSCGRWTSLCIGGVVLFFSKTASRDLISGGRKYITYTYIHIYTVRVYIYTYVICEYVRYVRYNSYTHTFENHVRFGNISLVASRSSVHLESVWWLRAGVVRCHPCAIVQFFVGISHIRISYVPIHRHMDMCIYKYVYYSSGNGGSFIETKENQKYVFQILTTPFSLVLKNA